MLERPKTLGDFIEILHETESVQIQIWIEELLRPGDPEAQAVVDQFCARPFDREGVLLMVPTIKRHIQRCLAMTCGEDLYESIVKDGHVLLGEMWAKAKTFDLEIKIGEIDGHLTPTEAMVGHGLATVKDGMVALTPKGAKVAQEFERELKG